MDLCLSCLWGLRAQLCNQNRLYYRVRWIYNPENRIKNPVNWAKSIVYFFSSRLVVWYCGHWCPLKLIFCMNYVFGEFYKIMNSSNHILRLWQVQRSKICLVFLALRYRPNINRYKTVSLILILLSITRFKTMDKRPHLANSTKHSTQVQDLWSELPRERKKRRETSNNYFTSFSSLVFILSFPS